MAGQGELGLSAGGAQPSAEGPAAKKICWKMSYLPLEVIISLRYPVGSLQGEAVSCRIHVGTLKKSFVVDIEGMLMSNVSVKWIFVLCVFLV